MRAADSDAALTPEQQLAADAGLKSMMPIHGRPFLDFVLSGLADAGITDVALVVAPDHDIVRHYYRTTAPPSRVSVTFVVQPEARGTADAVLAAERWTGGEMFLAINSDNLYPTDGLRRLAALDEPGLLAFDREDLVRSGNIPAERIAAFAAIEIDDDGCLMRIVEKPSPSGQLSPGPGRKTPLISMNCWKLDRRIFAACHDVPCSARGEYELPEAVGLAIDRGVRFRAVSARGPVLDLSRRGDAASASRHLAGVTPHP